MRRDEHQRRSAGSNPSEEATLDRTVRLPNTTSIQVRCDNVDRRRPRSHGIGTGGMTGGMTSTVTGGMTSTVTTILAHVIQQDRWYLPPCTSVRFHSAIGPWLRPIAVASLATAMGSLRAAGHTSRHRIQPRPRVNAHQVRRTPCVRRRAASSHRPNSAARMHHRQQI
jgi:hypothetical protein